MEGVDVGGTAGLQSFHGVLLPSSPPPPADWAAWCCLQVLTFGGGLSATIENAEVTNNSVCSIVAVQHNSTLIVKRANISNNKAATGVIAVRSAAVVVKDVSAAGNIGQDSGRCGGVVSAVHSNVDILGGSFHNNTAFYGGAIYATRRSAVNITGAMFEHNNADWGGACTFVNNKFVGILHTQFVSNTADRAGALYIQAEQSLTQPANARQALLAQPFRVNITGAQFDQNHAGLGGACDLANVTSVAIVDSQFSNNTAELLGGAISAGTSACHCAIVIFQLFSCPRRCCCTVEQFCGAPQLHLHPQHGSPPMQHQTGG